MKNFKNILTKPGRNSQPWAIWIWNLNISKKELIEQLDTFISQGFGGIAIRPGRDMFPVYLSEEFFELFEMVLQAANEKKIGVRIADDFSLPWSGMFESAMNMSRKLRAQHLVLTDTFLTQGRDEVEIPVGEAENTCILAGKIKDGVLNLSDIKLLSAKNSTQSLLWKVLPGDWKIFVFQKEFVRDPAKGYIPNVFNPKIAQIYLQNVLEVFKTHFSKYVPLSFEGFINEMPAYGPGDNAIPWDDDLVVKFRGKYKKDLLKLLPALFHDNCQAGPKIRQQIYTFILQQMYERFAIPLETWAKKNRLSQWVLSPEKSIYRNTCVLTDASIPAGSGLSAAGLQNIDGTEQNYALLKTVAQANENEHRRDTLTVVGRNRFGNAGTIQSLKSEVDRSLLAGSSRIIIDGSFFNVDQRSYLKTPFNPAWYAPGWENMKLLCGYISRVQEVLCNTHWNCQIAVLSPSSEILASFSPCNSEISESGLSALNKTINTLERCSLTSDVVSEELLSSCAVRTNGEFGTADRIRKGNYQVLIVPFSPLISRNVLTFCEKLLQKGGKIIFLDEAPKGTIEDGTTVSVISRIEKLFDPKKDKAKVISSGGLEEALRTIIPQVEVTVNGKCGSDVFCSFGSGDGYEVYVVYNTSDSKDYMVNVSLPDSKYFAAVDCESGDIFPIDDLERKNGRCSIRINASAGSMHFVIGSATRISHSKHFQRGINPFTMPQRSYRIVFKDQWTFKPQSLNALPLSTWNMRIGLSRESGGFSHFYESNFQVKSLPLEAYFVLNGLGGLNGKSVENDSFAEVSVNGSRVDKLIKERGATDDKVQNDMDSTVIPESSKNRLYGTHAVVYNVKDLLVRGFNRISIRTTGLITDPNPVLYPPIVLGTFAISKGQNGWVIDKPADIIGHDSWTKHGYPYLSGMGVYHQTFEIPNEYERLVLRFSQVSGTTSARLNDKPLSIFNWHPMEIDITSLCEPKRNELVVEVLNTMDNLLRMNGRPSGLIGEVFLDVY